MIIKIPYQQLPLIVWPVIFLLNTLISSIGLHGKEQRFSENTSDFFKTKLIKSRIKTI